MPPQASKDSGIIQNHQVLAPQNYSKPQIWGPYTVIDLLSSYQPLPHLRPVAVPPIQMSFGPKCLAANCRPNSAAEPESSEVSLRPLWVNDPMLLKMSLIFPWASCLHSCQLSIGECQNLTTNKTENSHEMDNFTNHQHRRATKLH